MARRSGLWVPFKAAATVAASTTADEGTDLLAFLVDADLTARRDMTIARIRGTVSIANSVGQLTSTDTSVALMVAHEGEDLAQTSLLSALIVSPIWRLDTVSSGRMVEVAAGDFNPLADVYMVDTKAMRKLDRTNNEVHMLVTTGGGSSVNVVMRGVIYVLLP